MAIIGIHEDLAFKCAQGLSATNFTIAALGDDATAGTTIASATNLATAQSAILNSARYAAAHEDFKRAIQRYVYETLPRMNATGIFTDTEIGAADTTALWRAGFTDNDTSLPAAYISSLEDD